MTNNKLQAYAAIVGIGIQAVYRTDAGWHGFGAEKMDGIEGAVGCCKLQFQVFFTYDALRLHDELAFEQRLREPLAPYLALQRLCYLQ